MNPDKLIKPLEEAETAKRFSRRFIENFTKPAFGAISKSEVDNLVFSLLIEIGALDPKSQAFEICRDLNITPSKARNLLFQWQLRNLANEADLENDLKKVISAVKFTKEGSNLSFGIESPLLREELRSRMKRIGVYADTSFSPEIVRMSVEHFVDFLDDFLDEEKKKTVIESLIRGGQLKEKSFKAVAGRILKGVAKKAIGEAADELAAIFGGIVQNFIDGNSDGIKEALDNSSLNELIET